MMQSPDFRNTYDSSQPLPLNRTRFRRILCQGQMSAGIQIVTEVSFENPSQMRLSEHDDVVEAFPANSSNQTLGKRIGKCRQLHRMVSVRHNAFRSRIHFTRYFGRSLNSCSTGVTGVRTVCTSTLPASL